MKFPSVTGSNLAGKRYQLPQEFEGLYNMVVVVYQRFQQVSVDSWGSLLEQLANTYPELRYYELPTLPRYGWIQQAMIDSGMRGGIQDKTVRSRTITLYLDVNQFNAALNIKGIDDIHVLLVNRQGDVLWQTSGDYSGAKAESLAQRLATLFSEARNY